MHSFHRPNPPPDQEIDRFPISQAIITLKSPDGQSERLTLTGPATVVVDIPPNGEAVDTDGDGVISAVEGDIDTPSDGFADNSRLYLPPTVFNRFAVTREINDGLLAPRFAPSQRAWVLTGLLVPVTPAVPASAGEDSDDR